jgi:hypothetical protein
VISLLVFICSFLLSYKLTRFLSSLTKNAITQLINTNANPINHKYFRTLGSVVLLLLNIEVIGDEIKSANKGGIDKTEIVKNVFDFEYCSSNNNWYVAIQLAPTPTPID